MKRTPLRPGKPLKRKQGLKRGRGLKPGKPLKRGKGLRKVNPERKAAKAKLQWGPGGGGGDYAILLRARPSDATGKGRRVPRSEWGRIDRLELAPQCVFAHVRDRGMGGVKGRWWDAISLTWEEHQEVHNKGWGNVRGLALLLAHSLAWAAHDAGIVPEPGCERPDVPAGVDDDAVQWYRDRLLCAWLARLGGQESVPRRGEGICAELRQTEGGAGMSKQPKHTPGPWEVDLDPLVEAGVGSITASKGAICRIFDYAWEQSIPEGASAEEVRANAHLIAAAPDLYKALEKAASEIGAASDSLDSQYLKDLAEECNHALASARGEGKDS